MVLRLRCQACNAVLRVDDPCAGKRGRCPRCRAIVEVPPYDPPASSQETPPLGQDAVSAPQLSLPQILAAFRGQVTPVPTTGVYRLGILLVTAALLTLSVVYVAMV